LTACDGEHELGMPALPTFYNVTVCDKLGEFLFCRADSDCASEGGSRRAEHLVRERGGGRHSVIAEVAKDPQLPVARVGFSHTVRFELRD
jgi:hypothetical protein